MFHQYEQVVINILTVFTLRVRLYQKRIPFDSFSDSFVVRVWPHPKPKTRNRLSVRCISICHAQLPAPGLRFPAGRKPEF